MMMVPTLGMIAITMASAVAMVDASNFTGKPYLGVSFALDFQLNQLGYEEAAAIFAKELPLVKHVKTFDNNVSLLKAIVAAGIDSLIEVAIAEKVVVGGLCNASSAKDFVGTINEVVAVSPSKTKFVINIGNEPFLYYPFDKPANESNTVECLEYFIDAILEENLEDRMKAVVPLSYAAMARSYPVEEGAFSDKWLSTIQDIARLQEEQGIGFYMNIYPFFAYVDNSVSIPQTFALGDDIGETLLGNQIKAVEFALQRALPEYTKEAFPITVSETGWPSYGHPFACVERAQRYVNNTARYLLENNYSAYIFEAFDEQNKSGTLGNVLENHFGLLTEAGAVKYEVPAAFKANAEGPPPPPGHDVSGGDDNGEAIANAVSVIMKALTSKDHEQIVEQFTNDMVLAIVNIGRVILDKTEKNLIAEQNLQKSTQ